MIGSILFMASALASYVLPDSGDLISIRLTVAGTLLGAVCFLIGAVLLFPAWRQEVHRRDAVHAASPNPEPPARR